jgi:glycosyltransferase involved in cell wall biosynthesis
MTTEFGGGGTEKYAEDIALGLAQKGVRTAVTVDSGELDRVRQLKGTGIPIVNLNLPRQSSGGEYRRGLEDVVRRLSPRVIHANVWRRQKQIAKVAAACRVPLIFSLHATPPAPRLREWLGINREPFALYRERALFRSNSAICISNLALRNLRMRVRGVRATVIYNGVRVPEQQGDAESKTAAPRILWVGSLIERKRPLLAIDAFRKVLARFPGARLVLAGDGPLMGSVRSAAESTGGGAIETTGFRSTVTDTLREGHIYLQTSAAEGLAYTVLEAMSVGLPVVATDVGATREAVRHGETGLLCRRDDAAGLADSLASLLSSAEKRSCFGRKGRELVRELFSLDRMIAQTLSAYEDLCGVCLPDARVAPDGRVNSAESERRP